MKKKSGVGCLFWLALALLIVVAFLYNRDSINRVLVSTGLLPDKGKPVAETPARPSSPQKLPPPKRPTPSAPAPAPSAQPAPRTPPPAPRPDVVIRVPSPPAPDAPPSEREVPAPAPEKAARKARIFFVQVSASGDIALRGVIRTVPYTDSPLTEALSSLLDGQAGRELTDGLLTMISPDVRLRGVQVKDGVAYVDLSDGFRFNALGRTGLVAQIKQLVYTATEFPSVTSVQILIEGRQIDYLSSEGPNIGKPISREQLIKGLS